MGINLQAAVDRLFAAFRKQGFMARVVQLAAATYSNSGPNGSGDPGTLDAPVYTVLVDALALVKDQFRSRGGQTLHVGDALIVMPASSATRSQLLGADWVEIDSEKFTIVEGEIKTDPFVTVVMLKRMQA